jgi:hypothetical protein
MGFSSLSVLQGRHSRRNTAIVVLMGFNPASEKCVVDEINSREHYNNTNGRNQITKSDSCIRDNLSVARRSALDYVLKSSGLVGGTKVIVLSFTTF